MRTRFGFPMALVLFATLPTFAQKPGEGRPGEGAHEQGQQGHEELASGCPGASILKWLPGTGPWAPTGAGTVVATSSCTRTLITRDGICSTTFTPGTTST